TIQVFLNAQDDRERILSGKCPVEQAVIYSKERKRFTGCSVQIKEIEWAFLVSQDSLNDFIDLHLLGYVFVFSTSRIGWKLFHSGPGPQPVQVFTFESF